MKRFEYFLRLLCPGRIYNYSTRVRIPKGFHDMRKFLIAQHVLKDGGSVIDGGAHIGYYTRYYSEIVRENGRVYSFEPNPYLFRLLYKYTKFNKNITALQKALSNQTSASFFNVEPFSLSADASLVFNGSNQKQVKVETVQLDQVIPQQEQIRLLKLDVENNEMQAILGSQQLIERCRPWIIFEYMQTPSRQDYPIISLLEKWGYSCFDITTLKNVLPSNRIDLTDIFAIPQGEKQEIVEALQYF